MLLEIMAAIELMIANIKRIYNVFKYGILILRHAGLHTALSKLKHQLYNHTVFYGVVKPIDTTSQESTFDCYTVLASSGDIDNLFSSISTESAEGRYQLLVRKWYHERGFGDCYVTKVKGTGEICAVRWLVTKRHLEQLGWERRFPNVGERDILRENVYVLERFRRMGVQTSATDDVSKICLDMGFAYGKGWVATDNMPELYASIKYNWLAFEKVLERHFLFHVTRKTIEIYDPPKTIPISSEISLKTSET